MPTQIIFRGRKFPFNEFLSVDEVNYVLERLTLFERIKLGIFSDVKVNDAVVDMNMEIYFIREGEKYGFTYPKGFNGVLKILSFN